MKTIKSLAVALLLAGLANAAEPGHLQRIAAVGPFDPGARPHARHAALAHSRTTAR